jgi:hypothetical protein
MENQMEQLDLPTESYFYAANIREWQVNDSITELIKAMKEYESPFTVFYVPQPIADDYEIRFFAPQVEGTIWLGNYK